MSASGWPTRSRSRSRTTTFDVARTETVLQHLADPAGAVSEMARVTRPGGRVGALELDQETMFLDHPDIELLDSLRDSIIRAIAQSSIGRQVPRLFVEAGLGDVQTVPHAITGHPHAFRLQFAHRVSALCEHGAITAARANQWWSAIDAAAAAEHFTGGITACVVWGPSPDGAAGLPLEHLPLHRRLP